MNKALNLGAVALGLFASIQLWPGQAGAAGSGGGAGGAGRQSINDENRFIHKSNASPGENSAGAANQTRKPGEDGNTGGAGNKTPY